MTFKKKRPWKLLDTVFIATFSVLTACLTWSTEALYKGEAVPWITGLVIQCRWEITFVTVLLLVSGLMAFFFFERGILYLHLTVVLLLAVVAYSLLLPLVR